MSVGPKTVFITGCSSGIGREAAEHLKANGWRVIASARKLEDVESLRSDGFEACRCDVTDPASMSAARDFVLAAVGSEGLFGLINNAGFGQPGAVEDLTADMLRDQFEVNVFGLVEMTNMFIPAFRKQGFGRIINISSVAGRISMPFYGAYCSSKFAVESLSDSLRIELRGSGIDVVLVEPGPIKTSFGNRYRTNLESQLLGHDSVHSDIYEGLCAKREKQKRYWSQTTKCSNAVILRALSSKSPRRRYLVTVFAHLGIFINRFMPAWALDRIMDWGLCRSGKKN